MAEKIIKPKEQNPDMSEVLLEKRIMQAYGHANSQEQLKTLEIKQRHDHHGEAQPVREAQLGLQYETNKKLDEIIKLLTKLTDTKT